MTSGAGPPCPVLVLGRKGITRDLVTHVLTESGHRTVDPEGSEIIEGRCVGVLVDPSDEHWVLAHRLRARVVLLASEPLGEDELVDATAHGADAILATDASPDAVVAAVETVAGGGSPLSPRQARVLADAVRRHRSSTPVLPALTNRERDILASIERGDSVKQTARHLDITPKTVENAQSRLFRKLGARNRAQAIQRVHELGLWPVPGAAS